MAAPRSRGLPRNAVRARIVECLRPHRDGMGKAELVRMIANTSAPSVQRALKDLEAAGALVRDTTSNRWQLVDPSYSQPLEHPTREDVQAVLIAEALVAHVADAPVQQRLRRLAEQLDERVSAGAGALHDRRKAWPPGGVTVSVTSATTTDFEILHRLLRSVRRDVMHLRYYSPWNDRRDDRMVEPWQVRVHDGALYLRAWDRSAGEPRTFRVAHIERASAVPAAGRPQAPVPRPEALWGPFGPRDTAVGDPAIGIDEDRADTASIVVLGSVARWLHPIVWGDQRDTWLVPGQRLRRTVRYRSCREMARRVLGILDAVESIEPSALRLEVEASIAKYRERSIDSDRGEEVG